MAQKKWHELAPFERNVIERALQIGNKTQAWREASIMEPDPAIRGASSEAFWRRPGVRDAFRNAQDRAQKIANKQLADLAAEWVAADNQRQYVEINAAWVLHRTALLADFNIRKFLVVEDGRAFYDFSNATDEDWYCIEEYTILDSVAVAGRIPADKVKLKAVSKLKALELVGRNIAVQAFKDVSEVRAPAESAILSDDELAARLAELGVC